jgi:hypothetical protein
MVAQRVIFFFSLLLLFSLFKNLNFNLVMSFNFKSNVQLHFPSVRIVYFYILIFIHIIFYFFSFLNSGISFRF